MPSEASDPDPASAPAHVPVSSLSASSDPSLSPPAPSATHQLEFTGDPWEFARIYYLCAALTVLTLGVYSAWASVRIRSYLARNTRLAGVSFDFHGQARQILVGRMLALILLALSFVPNTFSSWLPAAALWAMTLLWPLAMQRSLRFNARNLSWRGIRFGFDGTVTEAYRISWLGVMVAVIGTGLILFAHWNDDEITQGQIMSVVWGLAALWVLTLPWTAQRLDQFKAGHLRFGSARAHCEMPQHHYASMTALLMVSFLVVGVTMLVLTVTELPGASESITKGVSFGRGVCLFVLYILVLWLKGCVIDARYFSARWGATSFPEVATLHAQYITEVWLIQQFMHVFSSLFTVGLYAPFAVLANYRLKVTSIQVTLEPGFEAVTAYHPPATSAIGDELVDALVMEF